MSLNKFGGSFFVKNTGKESVATQMFTFKRSPELVYQLDNLFDPIFLQFQLIRIDGHCFIVLFVTPPQTKPLVITYLSIMTIDA